MKGYHLVVNALKAYQKGLITFGQYLEIKQHEEKFGGKQDENATTTTHQVLRKAK